MEDIKDFLFGFIDLFGNIFKQAFLLYRQYSNFRTQIIALALGVDPIVVSISSYILAGISIGVFLIKVSCRK